MALNLELCSFFGGNKDSECLIIGDDFEVCRRTTEAADKVFQKPRFRIYHSWAGDKAWPTVQNYAWQQTARCINDDKEYEKFLGWLWWEADAIPIRKGWLETLSKAHKTGRKLFTGHACDTQGVRYMNGVGIYPIKCVKPLANCGAFYIRNGPFDIEAGSIVMASFNPINHLMLHSPKERGGSEGNKFDSEGAKYILTQNSEAVFFHGCSDGSLSKCLMGKRILKEKQEKRYSINPTLLDLGGDHLLYYTEGEGKPCRYVLLKDLTMESVECTAKVNKDDVVSSRKNRIIHCVERHKQTNSEAKRRVDAAVQSWLELYRLGEVIPAHVWEPYDRSAQSIGDPKNLPYLKDILSFGLKRSKNDDDIIMLTNDDTILHPKTSVAIFEYLDKFDATCSGRVNFEHGSKPNLNGAAIKDGVGWPNDIGRDLFAFRKSWLETNWNKIPDFILGEPEWDLVLSALIRLMISNEKTTKKNRLLKYDYELPAGYVWHEQHSRDWQLLERSETPAKLNNMVLSGQFYAQVGMHDLVVK